MSRLPSGVAMVHGVGRLAFDAVEQLAHVVEGMHANIAAAPLPLGRGTDGRTRGIPRLVYESIRLVNAGARTTLDRGISLIPDPIGPVRAPGLEPLLSALNGVLGDHLAASGNPLAIPMRLRRGGRSLRADPEALREQLPDAGRRLVLLVHGLCMSDRQWERNGHDHGAQLARDLGATAVYAHYNSGRHVSENGLELAAQLEALLGAWPGGAPELAIVAHSMGGLVTRSAVHAAAQSGHAWPARLRQLVFLGTPHHGAPLERGGSRLESLMGASPYTAPLGRLGMLRSAGITDLRWGNVRDEDWRGVDRFARGADRRTPTPLPGSVACHALAGGRDRLVPVASALGRHADPERTLALPEAHRWVGAGIGHLDLLDHPAVYARLRAILAQPGDAGAG